MACGNVLGMGIIDSGKKKFKLRLFKKKGKIIWIGYRLCHGLYFSIRA